MSEPYSLFLQNVNTLRSLNSLPVALKLAEDICTFDMVHHGTNLVIINSGMTRLREQ